MRLTDKQLEKLVSAIESVDLKNAQSAIENAATELNLAAIKAARRVLVAEVRKLDKALAIYGLDIAIDEAKALIEKAKR